MRGIVILTGPGPLYARRIVAGWLAGIRTRVVLETKGPTLEARKYRKTSAWSTPPGGGSRRL